MSSDKNKPVTVFASRHELMVKSEALVMKALHAANALGLRGRRLTKVCNVTSHMNASGHVVTLVHAPAAVSDTDSIERTADD